MSVVSIPRSWLFSRRALVALIVPVFLQLLLETAVGMADSIMVSSVGEAAMSGVSLVDLFSQTFLAVFTAFATGGAVVVSQSLGAAQAETARRSVGQLMLLTLLTSTTTAALLLIFRVPLLQLAYGDVAPDVMENCLRYLLITVPSYPFIALFNMASALLRCKNDARSGLLASLVMNAVNLGGNTLLIYGFRLGVEGVAIPTLLSRLTAAVLLFAVLQRKDSSLRLCRLRELLPNRSLLRRILSLSLPNALEYALFDLGKILVVGMITSFGTAQIAANTILNHVLALLALSGKALSAAAVPVVGRCAGAREYRQVKFYTLFFIFLTFAAMLTFSLLAYLLLPFILRLYHASAEAAALIRPVCLLLCAASPLLWPASFILSSALRACSDVRFTTISAIASMWVVRIGVGFLLTTILQTGLNGIWIAMLLDWFTRSILNLPRFFGGRWKQHLSTDK